MRFNFRKLCSVLFGSLVFIIACGPDAREKANTKSAFKQSELPAIDTIFYFDDALPSHILQFQSDQVKIGLDQEEALEQILGNTLDRTAEIAMDYYDISLSELLLNAPFFASRLFIKPPTQHISVGGNLTLDGDIESNALGSFGKIKNNNNESFYFYANRRLANINANDIFLPLDFPISSSLYNEIAPGFSRFKTFPENWRDFKDKLYVYWDGTGRFNAVSVGTDNCGHGSNIPPSRSRGGSATTSRYGFIIEATSLIPYKIADCMDTRCYQQRHYVKYRKVRDSRVSCTVAKVTGVQ